MCVKILVVFRCAKLVASVYVCRYAVRTGNVLVMVVTAVSSEPSTPYLSNLVVFTNSSKRWLPNNLPSLWISLESALMTT